jgi:diguanylate cyclase (GGDEF)-like protein/putative nucleotidyltransferase with HDIG domain
MVDLDDLKRINDEFGHQVGDSVLRNFADVLKRCAGANGLAARLGGDEFAVIIPGADRKAADQLSWRLWDELASNPIHETRYASIYLGVSIGVSGYPWGGRDIEELIHWADVNLYANKLARKGFKHANDRTGGQELSSAVVEVLSAALEVRDKMTHRHARRVARLSATLAREMGLSEEDVLTIEYAAALHDIGKIGVPDEILGKPAALDGEEWESMRSHSRLGYEILNGVGFLKAAAEIVHAHHERFDGSGYPRGLRGEEIPLGARLFMVVDSYDAMTSRRVYRDAMPGHLAMEEIVRHAGVQFDPDVVAAFQMVMCRTLGGSPDAEAATDSAPESSPPIMSAVTTVGSSAPGRER